MSLFLVGTPIGNLSDITFRAIETLKTVDRILAEDTRQTAKLLAHYGIQTPTESFYEHNQGGKIPRIVEEMKSGKTFALVSDAGRPGISAPGHYLVLASIAAGIQVEAIPGPSAGLTALVISGLPSDRFLFEGFLPREGKARRRQIRQLAGVEQTLVLYEAPHRLLDTLRDLLAGWGDRKAAVARELTKRYEEVLRGPLSEIIAHFEQQEPRGEFSLVIEGKVGGKEEDRTIDVKSRLKTYLEEGMSRSEAAKKVSKELGVPKNAVYELAIEGIEDEEEAGAD
ncbi:MAG: 16S rRNA (cytidine(1402)-2'-O)-methyltransferase [Bacteroidota bacterium]